ncbi:MAG TPA: hypothetical protein PK733_10510 [Clostridiales bacterium]|nr:hypothetical protein [Clostridiales bacterium]
MKIIIKDPNTLRRAGIESLAKNLGPVGAVYFLRQYDIGEDDYTKERKELLKIISIEDVKKDMENFKDS